MTTTTTEFIERTAIGAVTDEAIGKIGIILRDNPAGATIPAGQQVVVTAIEGTYYRVTALSLGNIPEGPSWAIPVDAIAILSDPVPGQEYRVIVDRPRNATLAIGDTFLYERPHGTRACAAVGTGRYTSWWVSFADLDLPLLGTGTSTAIHEAVEEPVEEDPRITSLTAEVERLSTENRALSVRVSALLQDWSTDIEMIGEALMQAAEEHDFCGVYDSTVDSINSRLHRYELPVREHEIEATWRETYTVTVTRSATITARHGDESAAVEEYADNCDQLEEYELISLLRENGNHDFSEADDYDWRSY